MKNLLKGKKQAIAHHSFHVWSRQETAESTNLFLVSAAPPLEDFMKTTFFQSEIELFLKN